MGLSATAGISGDNGVRVGLGSAASKPAFRISKAIDNRGAGNEHAQPARTAEHALPELPHFQRMAADSAEAGIRSQPNPLSVTWHAQERHLHSMPFKTYFQ